jgi:hypothetical protein
MSNQGLDALATLAAAASPTANSAIAADKSGDMVGAVDEPNSDVSTTELGNSASILPSSSPLVPPMTGITAQQWQQAVVSAAASINALAGVGNQSNLANLGLQQLHQGPANNPTLMAIQQQLAMQQQMNYYQLLAQATSHQRPFSGNHGMQPNMPPPPPTGPIDVARQAISLALAARAQPSPPTVNGTLFSSYNIYPTAGLLHLQSRC